MYETQLSYAVLSHLSVNQILTSDLSKLNESHLNALETSHVTEPEEYIENMASLRKLRDDLERLRKFAFNKVWSREKSIFYKIERALWYFAENILLPDIRDTMGQKIDNYKRAYFAQYGILQKSLTMLSEDLLSDLFVLARSLRFFNETQDNVATMREILLKNKNGLVSLISILDEYASILGGPSLSDPSSEAPTLGTVPSVDPSDIPAILILDNNKEHCITTLELLRLWCENLLSLHIRANLEKLDAALQENQSKNIAVMLSQSSEIIDEIVNAEDGLLRGARQCISEYDDVVNKVITWREDVFGEFAERKWYNSDGRTVDDILDYVTETRELERIINSVDDTVEGITDRRVAFYEITQRFSDKKISDIEQAAELFTSRITRLLADLMRSRIAELVLFTEKVYGELFEHDQRISNYFQNKYDNGPVKRMRILKHPRPNLHKPEPIEIAKDAIVFPNDRKINLSQAKRAMAKLVDGYRLPMVRALDDLQADLRDQREGIEDLLDEIQVRYRAFRAQALLDENFVK